MTKYDEQSIHERISTLLQEANELAGIELQPERVTHNAAELAVTFHRLSREMARFGAARWVEQHLDLTRDSGEEPDDTSVSHVPGDDPSTPGKQPDIAPCADEQADTDEPGLQSGARSDVSPTSEPTRMPATAANRATILERPATPPRASFAERLKRQWSATKRAAKPASQSRKATVDRSLMKSIAQSIGECPKHLNGLTPLVRELELLESFDRADARLLSGLPSSDLNLLLTAFAFRLRAVQSADEWSRLLPEHHRRADRLHHRLAAMAKESQCGVVHGLARAHAPTRGSWLDDAREATAALRSRAGLRRDTQAETRQRNPQQVLNQLGGDAAEQLQPEEFIKKATWLLENGIKANDGKLVRAASHFIPDLMDVTGMSDLRRNAARFLDDQEDAEPEYTLPRDLSLLDITRGLNVVIVGGDPRNGREEVIRREFEFASCEWVHIADNTGKNRLASLCERIRSGGIDMVIVLSAFCSHTISERMFELKNETSVVLSRTYGIRQIEAAIERFLSGPARTED